jgi:hypothetical protein
LRGLRFASEGSRRRDHIGGSMKITDTEARALVADCLRVIGIVQSNLAVAPDLPLGSDLVPASPTMRELIAWDQLDRIMPRSIYIAAGLLLGSGHGRYARAILDALDGADLDDDAGVLH